MLCLCNAGDPLVEMGVRDWSDPKCLPLPPTAVGP